MSDNKPLMALVNEAAEIENRIIESNGELTPEIEALLYLNTNELSQKVDNYVGLMKKMELTASYYKDKAQFFLKLANTFDKVHDSCCERMLQALKTLGTDEIKGHDYKFKIYKSPPKLIIDDKEAIPEQYLIINTNVDIDKDALKSQLKNGAVSGAHLESGSYVKILANKG